jgi:hypothetical protein
VRIERGNYVVCLFDGFGLSGMVCDVGIDLIGDCLRSDRCIWDCRRGGVMFLAIPNSLITCPALPLLNLDSNTTVIFISGLARRQR